MRRRFILHLRDNFVGYVALFAALGGTSYAAVSLTAGSVTSRALARGAVTHAKLATGSIDGTNIINGSLTRSDFAPGTLAAITKGANGAAGATGSAGSAGGRGLAGPTGPAGAAGANGNGAIILRARGTGTVAGPHAATTSVPLNDSTWSQAPGEIDLVTGSVTMTTPPSCTGSFGNSLTVQVDGAPATFAMAPNSPASSTVTMPIAVMSVMEPGSSTNHHVTAALANSCTKSGEDFSVSDVKIDILKFS
jgi:hypothetical protein